MIAIYKDLNGEVVKQVLYNYFPPQKPKADPVPGNLRSQNESRRRAFALASLKVAQNPDMNKFLTLTYDPKKVKDPRYLDDIKNLFRGTHGKYIATFERHKNNPCLHIHLITNFDFETYQNHNGYPSIKRWHRGFSSIKYLEDTDDQFRCSKYVFKYMSKSEKVMNKFVYSSRGLLIKPEYVDFWWSDDWIRNEYIFSKYFKGLRIKTFAVSSNYKLIIGEKI